MKINPKAAAIIAVFVILVMMTMFMSCGKQTSKKRNKKTGSIKKSSSYSSESNEVKYERYPEENETPKSKKLTSEQKRTLQLYKRLENSYKLFKRQNYESALNEVDSVMRNLHKDPYLEAQAWAMSALIYEKQHKNSRKKRAYRKMVDCIEKLQKDPRYTKVYKEGMMFAETFDKIQELGGNIDAE